VYGSIMRGRLKAGRRQDFENLVMQITPAHEAEERGLHSVELAWEDSDPDRVVLIIHFRDRESYVRNAERQDTDSDYRRMAELLESPPEWIDVAYAAYLGRPLAATASATV
jgi:quinol monooxygenase YgiN